MSGAKTKKSKGLVIVESPAKARTIQKYLGSKFKVVSSMGHVRDLPKSKLGVNEEGAFEPDYQVIPSKKKTIATLKKAVSSITDVYLASDPDREGEAIGWHLTELLKGKDRRFHRVLFHEITAAAIKEAFNNASEIDHHKVDAQQARRILDRLVGYKISPLLWDKVKRGLSAGRVQSVALRLVCDREKERDDFKAEEYWTLTALLNGEAPPTMEAKLVEKDAKKIRPGSQEEMDQILSDLDSAAYVVDGIEKKRKKQNPPPPFTTSKLQQDSFRKLRMSVKRTMSVAQRLYEGLEVGPEGAVGLITYMRTDSTRISDDALESARNQINEKFGSDYLPAKPRRFKNRKGAQDAHECIRPTDAARTPESVAQFLKPEELKLYRLIYNRFVASQMATALFDETEVMVAAAAYRFKCVGRVQAFAGHLALYQEATGNGGGGVEKKNGNGSEPTATTLPALEEGQSLSLEELTPEQKFTQPPPRFTEASLVKEMEERGIGRPSTYSSILTTIQAREYVEKEERRLKPTELGKLVTELLVEHFGDIMDVAYTARMEDKLDAVEEGEADWVDTLKAFYERLKVDLVSAKKEMRDVKREEIPTDEVCEKCGKPMVIKWGRFGRFLACTGYPDCNNTREINGNGKDAPEVEETCPKCGKAMVLKRGRFGPFLACTGYPECKSTRKVSMSNEGEVVVHKEKVLDEKCPKCDSALVVKSGRFGPFTACSNYPDCRFIRQEKLGVKCPKEECGGNVVIRRSKKGRMFYGCDRYPDCDFVSWNKPLSRNCPKCAAPYLLEKTTKRDGTVIFCESEGCEFRESVA